MDHVRGSQYKNNRLIKLPLTRWLPSIRANKILITHFDDLLPIENTVIPLEASLYLARSADIRARSRRDLARAVVLYLITSPVLLPGRSASLVNGSGCWYLTSSCRLTRTRPVSWSQPGKGGGVRTAWLPAAPEKEIRQDRPLGFATTLLELPSQHRNPPAGNCVAEGTLSEGGLVPAG